MPTVKRTALLLLLLVLVLNYLPPVKGILEFGQTYRYTTRHGAVQSWEMPSKQPQFEGVQRGFQLYRQQHPETADTVLYRTFRRNPLLIWRWHDYLFHPRYRLPYLENKVEQESIERSAIDTSE